MDSANCITAIKLNGRIDERPLSVGITVDRLMKACN